jgi:CTP synthase (UTP-ammonia lyase)
MTQKVPYDPHNPELGGEYYGTLTAWDFAPGATAWTVGTEVWYYLKATDELKTKPTQHSVRELRSIGISPDMIVARSDHPVGEDLRDKIALFCDVEKRAVVPMVTAPVLYEVPLRLEQAGVGEYVLERLKLEPRRNPDWSIYANT